MRRRGWLGLAVVASLAVMSWTTSARVAAQGPAPLRVVSERTAGGFVHPESVACDPHAKVLYVSQFGSEPLDPARKDGKGHISRVSLDGKILEERFLPAAGETLDKPKGIWVADGRLWVTDIDVMWVFDLKTRHGRKLALPGAKFLNDPAVQGQTLFVSDNRADQLFRVEPADFLDPKIDPTITRVFSGKSINPNGLYPARDGSLLMVGFGPQPRGIYALDAQGAIKTLAKDLGRLDGLYALDDGTLLVTEWNAGALAHWSPRTGLQKLVSGFKGPADLCAMPESDGLTVVVPDLVTSQLRIVRLAR